MQSSLNPKSSALAPNSASAEPLPTAFRLLSAVPPRPAGRFHGLHCHRMRAFGVEGLRFKVQGDWLGVENLDALVGFI